MRLRQNPGFPALPLSVALMASAVYVNSLANGFAYDDVPIILESARVHDLSNQASIWLTPYWPGEGGRGWGLYRPLTIFLFALQWALGGGAPWVFHATNVALHAAVSVLVYALLARWSRPTAALAGALIFAVHPVHSEAVANIVGQAELWSAAFALGACLLYAGRDAAQPISHSRALAIGGLYLGAILTKESGIVLPALLLLADAAANHRQVRAAGLKEYARRTGRVFMVLLALAVIALALRAVVLGGAVGKLAAQNLPDLQSDRVRLLTALGVWPEYIRLFIFPLELSATYEPAAIVPTGEITGRVLLGAGLFAACCGLAALTVRRPAWGLPAAWFLVTILPTSNLIVPVGILLAERTLYLPSFALSAAVAALWEHLPRRAAGRTPLARRAALALAAVALLLLSARTVARNPVWRDTDSVLTAMMRDQPASFRPHWYAAIQAAKAGNHPASELSWMRAYRRNPTHSGFLADYGRYALQRDQLGRAIALLEQANRIRPQTGSTEFALALAYHRSGRVAAACAIRDRLHRRGEAFLMQQLSDSLRASRPSADGGSCAAPPERDPEAERHRPNPAPPSQRP